MNNKNLVFSFVAIISVLLIGFVSCKKINEATELGGGLIPPIDNITTFETYLDIETDNKLFNDTTNVYGSDYLTLGHIATDPEFGTTHANAYFDLGRPAYMTNPFIHKDSVVGIDSVVLSLSYQTAYGDTNSFQTLRVYELAQNSAFVDTSYYKYNQADFLTTGPELGNRTFQISKLDDSVFHIRKRDTTKLANVIRIPLSVSLGQRFAQYDTMNASTGGFRTDSLFKKLFKGLAIMSDNSGSALTYIDATDNEKTKLTVYFRVKNAGAVDTTSTDFYHYNDRYRYYPNTTGTVGQANTIKRTAAGNWATYLANATTNDDRVFLQSIPGSYAAIRIPALDTFRNSVIHKAELVLTPLRTAQDGSFTHPPVLFLDRINNAGDTAFSLDYDYYYLPEYNAQGSASILYNPAYFGGLLKSDSTYRINITRYMQHILNGKERIMKLRLFAPTRSDVFSNRLGYYGRIFTPNIFPGFGRVVIAGGSYSVAPEKRLKVRVVYSKL